MMNELAAYRAIDKQGEAFAVNAARQLADEIFAKMPEAKSIVIDCETDEAYIDVIVDEDGESVALLDTAFGEAHSTFERIADDLWVGKGRLRLFSYSIPRSDSPYFLRADGTVWDGSMVRH